MAGDAIIVEDLHKSYGGQVLFDGASCRIPDDRRVAVVGRNGAGKSTLLRVILGQESVDSGRVILADGLRIGYLEQSDPFKPDETLLAALERLSAREGWRCSEMAARFLIPGDILDQPAAGLSGGWQTRARLCALLLAEPDFLLLDEPTNYLDLRTLVLLEGFLRAWKGGFMVVSHDREFLRRTTNATLSVGRGKIATFPGTIDDWLAHRAERQEATEKRNANLAGKVRQLEDFVARNKARASTATQAQSKQKLLEKLSDQMGETEEDGPDVAISLQKLDTRRPGAALRLDGLAIGYPGRTVASGIDLEIERGRKVAVLGDNGQGKSTLLKTLAGVIQPMAGTLRWGYGIRVGFYHQHVYQAIPATVTVAQWLERCAREAPRYVTSQQQLDLAGAFLFRGDAVKKTAGVLSGGERARLSLAGLLLGGYDVLLLDEPVNHLDVETAEALRLALANHDGTAIIVAHDRSFISGLATDIIEVAGGGARAFSDGYATYCWRIEQESAEATGDVRKGGAAEERKPGDGGTQREAKKKTNELRTRLKQAETSLRTLETQRDQLTARITSVPNDVESARRLATVTAQVAEAEETWLELAGQLERNEP